jgi:hypothetical protein
MSEECSICFDNLYLNDELAVTRCGHCFHHACVTGWISSHKTCPQCRVDTTAGDVIKVHAAGPSAREGANVNNRGGQPTLARDLYGQIALMNEVVDNQANEIKNLERMVRLFSRLS